MIINKELKHYIDNELELPREYTLVYEYRGSRVYIYKHYGAINEEYLYSGKVDSIEDLNGILNDLDII